MHVYKMNVCSIQHVQFMYKHLLYVMVWDTCTSEIDLLLYMVTETSSEPICGIVHTSTHLRYFNPDDNLVMSLTAFPIDSP